MMIRWSETPVIRRMAAWRRWPERFWLLSLAQLQVLSLMLLLLPGLSAAVRAADTDTTLHQKHLHGQAQTDPDTAAPDHLHGEMQTDPNMAVPDHTGHSRRNDHSTQDSTGDPARAPAHDSTGDIPVPPADPHHDHAVMVMADEKDPTGALADQVMVDERPGRYVELDARFQDSRGQPVELGALFGRPVVLLPIWFLCPSVCSFLQADLAKALNRVDQVPGEDFNVITLSFSDDENPSHALAAKKNYANLIQREFPLENWYYLTGDAENIKRVTDSLGYYFVKKQPHFYIHPNVLVVLGSDGKIIRYLYGPGFLPFDLGMALTEAQKGEPGVSIKRKVLSFCFDYDPENKTYVFRLFRITGTAILILLTGFLVFLLRPAKKRKQGRTGPRDG
jgi:protein SCO1